MNPTTYLGSGPARPLVSRRFRRPDEYVMEAFPRSIGTSPSNVTQRQNTQNLRVCSTRILGGFRWVNRLPLVKTVILLHKVLWYL